MTRLVIMRTLIATAVLTMTLGIGGGARAEGESIILLFPTGAVTTFDERDYQTQLKRYLKDLGYSVDAVGEYDPEQDLDMVRQGASTGIIAYEEGGEGRAAKLLEELVEFYPQLIIGERPTRKDPIPAGAIGLLLPGPVSMERQPELQPPPYDLRMVDISVEIDGEMSQPGVQALFDEHKGDLVKCWPKAAARNNRMEGRIVAKVTVDSGGDPLISSILETPDDGASWVECVSEAYLGWTYPETTNNLSAKVTIGVSFVAQDSAPEEEEPPPPPPAEEPASGEEPATEEAPAEEATEAADTPAE